MRTLTGYDRYRLDELQRQQEGVVTRAQLLACGMTRSAIQHRIKRGGPWYVLLPGIYAVDESLNPRRRMTAALLHAGPEAAITGPYALRLLGITASGGTAVDVLVPEHVRRLSSGFVHLIRTTRMPDICEVGILRLADPVRAVADAVRHYRDINDARSVICAALESQRISLLSLGKELDAGPARGAALLRQAVRDVAHNIWSAAEGDLLDLIRQSSLPVPQFNVAIYDDDGTLLGIVDAWWERAGVAAEVDSRQFHSSEAELEAMLERHNRLSSRIRLLHFRPRRIKTEPRAVLAELQAAINDGLRTPTRPLTAIPVDQQGQPRMPMAPTAR